MAFERVGVSTVARYSINGLFDTRSIAPPLSRSPKLPARYRHTIATLILTSLFGEGQGLSYLNRDFHFHSRLPISIRLIASDGSFPSRCSSPEVGTITPGSSENAYGQPLIVSSNSSIPPNFWVEIVRPHVVYHRSSARPEFIANQEAESGVKTEFIQAEAEPDGAFSVQSGSPKSYQQR
jgi:hypothetical protein